MQYLAAYALVALNGQPTKDKVKAVLKAGGVEADSARLDEVFANFDGKNFADVVKAGRAKIDNAGPASAGAPAAAAAAPSAAAAPKKEEKKAESEGDDDMGFGLFD